jgi:hypothetical protein
MFMVILLCFIFPCLFPLAFSFFPCFIHYLGSQEVGNDYDQKDKDTINLKAAV